jgi:uncharacterized protein
VTSPGSPLVATIVRYPVKGLGGESLDATSVGLLGIPFDRVLGLANGSRPIEQFGEWTDHTAFHALASRADLANHSARVLPAADGGSLVVITRPRGETLEIPLTLDGRPEKGFDGAAAIAQSWFGGTTVRPVTLVASGTHLWDVKTAPVSLINLATVRQLGEAANQDLDAARFRANIYVDELAPWREFELVGRTARLGSVRLGFVASIDRCRATSADPARGVYDVNVPGLLHDSFGHTHCGVYAMVLEAGEVRRGDELRIDPPTRTPVFQTYYNASAPRFARVKDTISAADKVKSVSLVDPSGLTHGAGPSQYLRVHRVDHAPTWRNYSLSAISDSRIRITVGLREDGQMSPWIHSRNQGDSVLISGPFGEAVETDCADPLIILTGGIGITPALALMQRLHEQPRRVVQMIHVNADIRTLPHWDEVMHAFEWLPNARAELYLDGSDVPEPPAACDYSRGRPSPELLGSLPREKPNAVALVCGSAGFTQTMVSTLLENGMPRSRIHTDPFFPPRQVDLVTRDAPLAGPFLIDFGSASLSWNATDGSILDLAYANGIDPPASCRTGVCGSCAVRIDGPVFYRTDPVVDVPEGLTLICCAVPTSDIHVLLDP